MGCIGHRTFFQGPGHRSGTPSIPSGADQRDNHSFRLQFPATVGSIDPLKTELTRKGLLNLFGPAQVSSGSQTTGWMPGYTLTGKQKAVSQPSFLAKRIHASASSPVMASPHKHPAVPLSYHPLPGHLPTSSYYSDWMAFVLGFS